MPPITPSEGASLKSGYDGKNKKMRNYGSGDNIHNTGNDESNIFFKVPRDKYNLAYLSFFLIGIGMLLPWNFFINASQYFKDKLKVLYTTLSGFYYQVTVRRNRY